MGKQSIVFIVGVKEFDQRLSVIVLYKRRNLVIIKKTRGYFAHKKLLALKTMNS